MTKLSFFVRSALFLQLVTLPYCAMGNLYITHPLTSTTCTGGKQCEVDWVDDGTAPFVSDIGPCYVGLYNGNGVLVQQIEPVDVASVHSLTFTPDSKAGPISSKYYINFTGIDTSKEFQGFSTFFTLTGMSGSLSHPNPSDTSVIPVPSTVASPPPQSIQTTITVGGPQPSASSSSSSGSFSGSSSSQSNQTVSNSRSGTSSSTVTTSASSSVTSPPPSPSPATPSISSGVTSVTSLSSSSFITIRTSSPFPSPPQSSTTLIISAFPTNFLSSSDSTVVPSAIAGASQTNSASGLKPEQGAGMLSVAFGAMVMVALAWT
ncbi:hypothetical protein BDY19DRAFT_189303 [Irpex rosettiformis]|uniref:Uncharacterized protein n=1 Tax=Irpex rosettiformis TaxID=378272 RepID=A0ACB8U2Q6_9APHY|nr:hypothetical protein BDY19DRAFT_189303 [Irpex rosettiformis]